MNFNKSDAKINAGISQKFSFDFSEPYIRGKKVLNVGCWTGGYESFAQDICDITGIDIVEAASAMAIAKEKVPNAKFVETNPAAMPFADKTFDVVTMWATFEHLTRNEEMGVLKEINRVLKDGGYLFLSTPSNSWLSILLDPAYFIKGHRHYGKKKLMKMLQDAGLVVDKIEHQGGFFAAFNAYIMYFFKYVFRKELPNYHFYNQLMKKEFNLNKATFWRINSFRDYFLLARK